MTRPLIRVVGALLTLAASLVVLTVTATGLLALLAGMVLTAPSSQGRIVAATMATGGLVLLVGTHAFDRYALRRALDQAGTVASQLIATVATGGRQ